jgi:hypothetical protein
VPYGLQGSIARARTKSSGSQLSLDSEKPPVDMDMEAKIAQVSKGNPQKGIKGTRLWS